MTPEQKAKEMVNNIYQPLGYLSCNVSSGKMWNYAKAVARDMVLFSMEQYENDQYKRKTDFLENLLIEINKL